MSESYFAGEPVAIGGETQLLVGDTLIEDRWGLRRVLHSPVRFPGNPVVFPDRPWEGDTIYGAKVFHDPAYGRYRMWYGSYYGRNHPTGDGPLYCIAYAESDDGLHWEKPLMEHCPLRGHARTNLVHRGFEPDGPETNPRYRTQIGDVFRDETDPDPARRYKMIALEPRLAPAIERKISCVNLLCSPDGLRWTMADQPPILDYHSDCENHVVRDARNGRWLLYGRPAVFSCGQAVQNASRRHHRRRVVVAVSTNLARWSYPRMCLYPDELDVPDFDHVRAFTYGSSFLMLYGAMDGDETGCNEIRLAGSPDGLRWTAYYTREPFLKRGPEGTWDHGSVRPSCPPVRQDGRLLLYYSGATLGQHQAGTCLTGVGVAVMSPDRFVEQRAGEQAGYLLTKEIVMQGNRLRLNTVPDPRPGCNPELKVEIAQRPPAGRALDGQHAWPGFSLAECDPVRLGGTDAAVTWRQSPDISALAGKPVYLRFALRSAGLFAFRVDRE